jgi:hypothetical protein
MIYTTGSQPVVRVSLEVRDRPVIGNGGKRKKGVKIKTQKQRYEIFGLQRETYVKVVTRPAHH